MEIFKSILEYLKNMKHNFTYIKYLLHRLSNFLWKYLHIFILYIGNIPSSEIQKKTTLSLHVFNL